MLLCLTLLFERIFQHCYGSAVHIAVNYVPACTPQQPNAVDCGLYLLLTIDNIIQRQNTDVLCTPAGETMFYVCIHAPIEADAARPEM
jgi:hypothetical protein